MMTMSAGKTEELQVLFIDTGKILWDVQTNVPGDRRTWHVRKADLNLPNPAWTPLEIREVSEKMIREQWERWFPNAPHR